MGGPSDAWGYFPMGMIYSSQQEQTLSKERMIHVSNTACILSQQSFSLFHHFLEVQKSKQKINTLSSNIKSGNQI